MNVFSFTCIRFVNSLVQFVEEIGDKFNSKLAQFHSKMFCNNLTITRIVPVGDLE